MTLIPLDSKINTISANQDTREKRSALINNKSEYYTLQDLQETIGGGNTPVLTTYPTTDASKAGEQFIYKNELWRYLNDGETALPVGTPWPLKGYKQFTVQLSVSSIDFTIIGQSVNRDDFNIGHLLPSFTKINPGEYSSLLFDIGSISNEFKNPYIKTAETSQSSSAHCSSTGIGVAGGTNAILSINAYINGVKADGTDSSVSIYTVTTKVYPPSA